RHREPLVGNIFRLGAGRDGGGFWRAGGPTQSPRAPRLARDRVYGARGVFSRVWWVEYQGAAETDCDIGDISPVVNGVTSAAGARSEKPFAGARAAISLAGRVGA